MIGLNVGSGQRRFSDSAEITWVNVDKISRPGHEPDLVCDGAHLPYGDESVDYFVLHHVCEHFQCGEAIGLIQEANRVLKPRGSLFVFVPDLRALAIRWLAGGLTTQIYVTNLYGAYMGSPEDTHKWGFDSESLNHFLWTAAPWWGMKPFDFREISGMDAARDFWILSVECVK